MSGMLTTDYNITIYQKSSDVYHHNLDFYIDLSKDNIPGYDMIIGI